MEICSNICSLQDAPISRAFSVSATHGRSFLLCAGSKYEKKHILLFAFNKFSFLGYFLHKYSKEDNIRILESQNGHRKYQMLSKLPIKYLFIRQMHLLGCLLQLSPDSATGICLHPISLYMSNQTLEDQSKGSKNSILSSTCVCNSIW